MTLTKPGPATSTDGRDVVEHAGVDDALRQLPRVRPESLGERERTVDLRVGTIRRPHRRIRVSAGVHEVGPGDLVEDGPQQIGECDDRIRHASASLPDRVERRTDR